MRRSLGVLVVLLLMIPAIAALGTNEESYRDDFKQVSYSGDDGSLEFPGPWVESGDGSGASGGKIHVGGENCSNNDCLHIEGTGLVIAGYEVARSADISSFESVELSYDVRIIPQGPLNTASLLVDVYDGSRWVQKASYSLAMPRDQSVTIPVTQYANEGFAIRFRVPGLSLLYNGFATIDRVVLSGVVVSSTTTSSTTSTSTTSSTTSTTSTTAPTTHPTSTTSSTSTTSPPSGSTSATTSTTSVTGTGRDTTSTTTTTTTPAGGAVAGPTSTVANRDDQTETTTTTGQDGTVSGPIVAGGGPSGPPPDSGLRDPGAGLIADYSAGMMGDMDMEEVEVLGAELTADFSLAVEAFEVAKVWIALLTLVIGAVIVSGMDSRRARNSP